MEQLKVKELRKRAFSLINRLIETYGPRLTGSDACKNVAHELTKEFAQVCDSSHSEVFSVHPDAFLGWIKILVVIYPIALVLLWLSMAPVALVLMLFSVALLILEFIFYKEIIDPLFPKKEGVNVYGVLDPVKEVKSTVIVSGHHDSAKIFNFFVDKPHLYSQRIYIGLGSVFALTAVSIIQSIFVPFSLGSVVSWPFMIVLVPLTLTLPWIVKLWSFASKEGTPGAGDNLIASAIAVEVARYFSDSKELQHTRIIAASYDSEESGLRGARAFFKRHKHNESLLMGKVYNFNIDCPYEAKEIFFLTSDINGSVKLSESMAQRCTRIAHTLGYDAVSKPIAMLTGGTDAAEAAKVGIEATTLMAMPWDNSSRSSVYHTPQDTPDAIEPEAVEISLEIAIHVIKEIDQLSVE